jgi:hypothetical protein
LVSFLVDCPQLAKAFVITTRDALATIELYQEVVVNGKLLLDCSDDQNLFSTSLLEVKVKRAAILAHHGAGSLNDEKKLVDFRGNWLHDDVLPLLDRLAEDECFHKLDIEVLVEVGKVHFLA